VAGRPVCVETDRVQRGTRERGFRAITLAAAARIDTAHASPGPAAFTAPQNLLARGANATGPRALREVARGLVLVAGFGPSARIDGHGARSTPIQNVRRTAECSEFYSNDVGDGPTVEYFERASLIELTCQEIAVWARTSSDHVLRIAFEAAEQAGRPIDDVLRDWFRALVL
jgi:hypothetical protein